MQKTGILGAKKSIVYAMENNDSIYVCISGLEGFLKTSINFLEVIVTLDSDAINPMKLHWTPLLSTFSDSEGYSPSQTNGSIKTYPNSELTVLNGALEFRIDLGELNTSKHISGIKLSQMEIAVGETAPGIYKNLYLYSRQDRVQFVDEYDPLISKEIAINDSPFLPNQPILASAFNLSFGWGTNVINSPAIPFPFHNIVSGGNEGFFVYQQLPTQMVHFMTYNGDILCSLALTDLYPWTKNLWGFIDGPNSSAIAIADMGRMIQINPPEHDEEINGVICSVEDLGTINVHPLVYADGFGVIGMNLGNGTINLYPDENEPPVVIAEGFRQIYKADVTQNGELIVWDTLLGQMHMIDLSTGASSIIYNPRNYNDSLDMSLNPDPEKNHELYFFTRVGKLFILDIRNGSVTNPLDITLCTSHPNILLLPNSSAFVSSDVMSGAITITEMTRDGENITRWTTSYLQEPTNTRAFDVSDDGDIIIGHSGCNNESGYLKITNWEGDTTTLSEMPDIIRKVKSSGENIFVLGVWESDNFISTNATSDIVVLDTHGNIQYSKNIGKLNANALSILNTDPIHGLACEQWRNICIEFGPEGIVRQLYINFMGADQPLLFSNQSLDGAIYAFLGWKRGLVDGIPTVDFHIMELDLETKTFKNLLQTQHTGSDAGGISLDTYTNSNNETGLFFYTRPGMTAYHITPEGLAYLRSNSSEENIPSIGDLLQIDIDGIPIIEQIGNNLPMDALGIGAGITENEHPYAVISSNIGYIQFYKLLK